MQINPIQLETPPDTDREDYYQSANAFFHFMKNDNFLYDALSKKALTPRYCREDVRFLHLNLGDTAFEEIAVLQKCFCDIPLHNITSKFPIKYESKNAWPYEHTELYGEFAIAFSKQWGELKQLQPIQYINDNSFYLNTVRQEFDYFLRRKNLSEKLSNSLLYRLAFIKPLRGEMQRVIDTTIIKKAKISTTSKNGDLFPLQAQLNRLIRRGTKLISLLRIPKCLIYNTAIRVFWKTDRMNLVESHIKICG